MRMLVGDMRELVMIQFCWRYLRQLPVSKNSENTKYDMDGVMLHKNVKLIYFAEGVDNKEKLAENNQCVRKRVRS